MSNEIFKGRNHKMVGGPSKRGINNFEKPENFLKIWKKLVLYCKFCIPQIIVAFIFAIIGTIFTIVGPNKLSQITDLITDGLISGIDLEKVQKIAVFLSILYGLGFVFNYIQGFIMATVTQRLSKSLRTDISEKINRLPLKYFDSTSYGDVLSRVTNDVDTIGQTMNQSVGVLVSEVTLFLGSLFMMLKTNLIMTFSAVIATIIGFLFMILIISKSQKYFLGQQKYLGKINGHIEEIYSGHVIVKVYNGEEKAKKTFDKINEKLYESAWKSQFLSGLMMPLMGFIGNFAYVTVCVVGGTMALDNKITFGVIVAFMIYVRLFTRPLSQIAQAFTNMQSTAAASERVFEFLDETELEDESYKTEILASSKGDVEFKNVKFGYTPEKIIINDFSVHVSPGQKIAIVGPTGAGKTTIVNLLMRFYEVNSGEIKIDGISTKKLTRENVHDFFCMVLQDTWLFEGSVKENIVYSKEGISDDEVINACKAVGIHHFIESLPMGYDTVLNDKVNLSTGQKQLITIARAMVEKAPLLILDEATSSVDTSTEELIQRAMDKLTVGRTSFVIAHRLSTIRNADLILVMKDGDIIESGNHEDLLS